MKVNLAGVSVMLIMPTNRELSHEVVISLLETAQLMRTKHIPFDIQIEAGCSIVEWARSSGAHHFLRSEHNKLFWVDSDIVWKADDFLRLVALSTVMPVVGAPYVLKKDPPEFRMSAPVTEDVEANEWGCLPIWGVGLGFTVVAREVMERLATRAPKLIFPWEPETPIASIFRCDFITDEWTEKLECDGAARGEDMAFFSDVRDLGYSVHLCPDINLRHIGPKGYGLNFADFLKKMEVPHGAQ